MGLTLNYKLRAPAKASAVRIKALIGAMHTAARALQRAGRVAAVSRIGTSRGDLFWLSEWLSVPMRGDPHTSRGGEVPALAGHVFTVMLGDGCEPLRLGLCRYPDRVPDHQTGRTRAVRSSGWRLAGFCKTQYAGLHGWEHFRRCHTAAVELLASLNDLGLPVEINDEGGYWPGRDEVELRHSLDRMNGIVAAFAGALIDATDETGGPPLQAPILAHPQFERIEAEGTTQHAPTIAQATAVIRNLRRPGAK